MRSCAAKRIGRPENGPRRDAQHEGVVDCGVILCEPPHIFCSRDCLLVTYVSLHYLQVGIGVGKVSILHIGGSLNRMEYLAAGDPLVQAFTAEHHVSIMDAKHYR